MVEKYRAQGLMPAPGELAMSESIEHGVFEVPTSDAEQAKKLAMGTMAGMQGMAMPGQGAEGRLQEGHVAMSSDPRAAMDDQGEVVGFSVISSTDQAAANARTVPVKMREWGFSPGNIKVKLGEVIRFTVTNIGNVPHEFMFMPPAAMNAVRYRLQRADWNLLEHEAPFEKSVIMPGDKFEVVLKIEKPGVWMFMCMFPYHMQLGMMGSMSTEGMAMDMGEMNM